MASSNSPAAGEIRCAKSVRDNDGRSRLARAALTGAPRARRSNSPTGKALNWATKLTL
jgi:hypothetical protein